MLYLDLDFETKSEEDIKNGPHKYASHPSTEILMMSYNFTGVVGETKHWDYQDGPFPRKVIRAAKNPDIIFRAHNAYFEYCIWNIVGVRDYNLPPLPIERWQCTQAQAQAYTYAGKLEIAGEQMDLEVQKDPRGKRLITKFCIPRKVKTPGVHWNDPADHVNDYEDFKSYNVDDTETQVGIANTLPPLSAYQWSTYYFTQRVNLRGVPIDTKLAKAALKVYNDECKVFDARVNELTDGQIESGRQREAVKGWLHENSCPIPDMQAATIERWLGEKDKFSDEVREMLTIRSSVAMSSISKYKSALAMVEEDGRIHEALRYHGARTGRWTGMGFQIHNLKRPTLPKWTDYDYLSELIIAQDVDTIKFLYGDVMEALSSCVRSIIKAQPGNEIVCADYSAIEARVLVWLADDWKGIKLFKDGEDPYIDMAADIYGIPAITIKKDSWERFVGKQAILGLGYQMGGPKFVSDMYEKANVHIELKFANKVVATYRKKYKKVKTLWSDVEKAAVKACLHKGRKCYIPNKKVYFYTEGKFLFCVLPSGRRLAYPEFTIKNNRFNKPAVHYKNNVNGKWFWTSSYGGKFVENIVQAISADIMANGMEKAEAADYPIIMSVHDESASEVKRGYGSVKEYEELLCDLPHWAEGCPVTAEGWRGTRYRK